MPMPSALARIDPGLLARIGPPTFAIEYDNESESITNRQG